MTSETFVWPHETENPPLRVTLDRLFFSQDPKLRQIMGRVWHIALEILVNLPNVYLFGQKDPFPHVYEETMELFNGREAAVLANKYKFIEVIKKLNHGYRVPRQTLVTAHPSKDLLKETLKTINSWSVSQLYLKPVTGGNSRGIRVVTPETAEKYLTNVKEDYIVQEEIDFVHEYRWAISRGFDGLVRRFCYEKVRPQLTGNGRAGLWHLILKDKLPLHTKLFLLWNCRRDLLKVIPHGEKYETTQVANPPRGSFERNIYDDKLVSKFDNFFRQLIEDLEEHQGAKHPWPLLCFDFGLTRRAEVSKDTLVLIELQMPFSALVYFGRCRHRLAAFLYFYYSALPS